jgi:hypothetical protein
MSTVKHTRMYAYYPFILRESSIKFVSHAQGFSSLLQTYIQRLGSNRLPSTNGFPPTPPSSLSSPPRMPHLIPRVTIKNRPESERMEAAAAFVNTCSITCVFHLLIKDPNPLTPHSSIEQCPQASQYIMAYRSWREKIKYDARACFRCGCPYSIPVWEHGHRLGKQCTRTNFQDWVRPMAYIEASFV